MAVGYIETSTLTGLLTGNKSVFHHANFVCISCAFVPLPNVQWDVSLASTLTCINFQRSTSGSCHSHENVFEFTYQRCQPSTLFGTLLRTALTKGNLRVARHRVKIARVVLTSLPF